jgi:shikimate kinase
MGSGKTRLAKVLGESLNSDYFDLDDCISSSLGKNIDEIFEKEGELIFRKVEKEQLRLFEGRSGIISVGGGTPCYYENMKWMNLNGTTVYLKAKIPTLVSRILNDKMIHRPLLKGVNKANISEFVAKHLFERRAFYEQCDIMCDTEKPGWEKELIESLESLD